MAIGFGDLVPYSQLPGSVAGQMSENVAGAYNRGVSQSAAASKAQSEADMSDMADKLAQEKLPSALALSNLKDAQSLNYMPPKPTVEHITKAEQDILGSKPEGYKPTAIDHAKVMARAQELADADEPKYDPSDPSQWLANVKPHSNQEMNVERAKLITEGRVAVGQQRYDLGQDNLAYKKEIDPIHEQNKLDRAHIVAGGGAAGSGGLPLKVLAAGRGAEKDFDKSQAGQFMGSKYGDTLIMDPENGQKYRDQIKAHMTDLEQLGNNQKTLEFAERAKKYLPAGYKPKLKADNRGAYNDPSNGPIGQDQMLAGGEPQSGGRGPSEEGTPTVAKSLSGINPDGSIDMPEENESGQLRAAASRDVGQAVDSVTQSPIYKGVASGLSSAAQAIGGSGKPQPLMNEPRKTATNGQEVQKYSDGKWYPVGSQPEGENRIVSIGGVAHRIGDIVNSDKKTLLVVPGKTPGLGAFKVIQVNK